MTELEALNAIYSRIIAGWETAPDGLHRRDAATYPDVATDPLYVPLALKNETYRPDQLGLLGAWARVTVRWSTAEQTTQGGPDVRTWEPSGFVIVDLFAPPGEAMQTLAQLAEDVRTVMRGQRLGDTELCVYEGPSRSGPDAPDWATQAVWLRFSFEQTG